MGIPLEKTEARKTRLILCMQYAACTLCHGISTVSGVFLTKCRVFIICTTPGPMAARSLFFLGGGGTMDELPEQENVSNDKLLICVLACAVILFGTGYTHAHAQTPGQIPVRGWSVE